MLASLSSRSAYGLAYVPALNPAAFWSVIESRARSLKTIKPDFDAHYAPKTGRAPRRCDQSDRVRHDNDQENLTFRLVVALGFAGSASFAAGGERHIEDFDFSFEGPFGAFDTKQLAQTPVCKSYYRGSALHCHRYEVRADPYPCGLMVPFNFPKDHGPRYARETFLIFFDGRRWTISAPHSRSRPFPWVLRWKPAPRP